MRMLAAVMLTAISLPASCGTTIVPDAPVMKLDEIGLYEVSYALRDGKWHSFPTGWSGFFDEQVGIACQPHGEQGDRRSFLLHPPWRQGAGTVRQEFTFQLPKAGKITLRGATAMRDDIIGKSDGVTFRVLVNGRKLLNTHRRSSEWKTFEFDLTHLAGKPAVVRFETDSGPKDNPGWDFSLWGGRELVLQGFTPRPVAHPNPPPLEISRVCSRQNGSVAPIDGFGGTQTTYLKGDTAVFSYEGQDGKLEYRWSRPGSVNDPVLGTLRLHATMAGDKEVAVPLAGGSRIEWKGAPAFQGSRWSDTDDGAACTAKYKFGTRTATLTVSARMLGKSLVLDVRCDTPAVQSFDAGAWGPVLRRRKVTVPYYSGQVDYLPNENLFANSFLDWTSSGASQHDGSIARYHPLTDGTLNRLNERVVYSAAWHLAEVLPNIPNPPSPFIGQIGGKIVLDVWGGRYTDIARKLETLHSFGIRNCIILAHDWQRSGYDNALPMHIPANANLGGDEGMKTLVETGRRLGYTMALHENYVDYYPNYDHFDEKDVSLDPQGKRINAWYNPGTKIQSFAVKPNAILPLARTQSPEIHSRYGTNACYLDVHSAVPPGFHVDFRAGEEGAGMLDRVWDVHRELWNFERKIHGGPVFGEGNAHWYWSGCLDGVEAQFGSGWGADAGESAPLAIDFDLLKIHPLQLNHGMGYYERWSRKTGWSSLPPMVALDQYRMQEVIYGHAGFLGAANWSNVPQAWLEHHLLSPVMERYASANPVEIGYQVSGKWVDGSATAKAGVWNRARVRYDSGLVVTANDSDQPLTIGRHVLPRFGWLADGAGVTAYTALRDGVVVDYAETKESVFANAREAALWNTSDLRRVRPSVARFDQTGPREFRISYQWKAEESLDRDYHCFVHFVAPGEGFSHLAIFFQDDHALPRPTSGWKSGDVIADGPRTVRLPDDVSDGDYRVRIGLFTQADGRAPLLGSLDDETRVKAGVVHVRDQGRKITFEPEKSPSADMSKLYSLRLNASAKVIDFGTVRTNGSVLVRREGGDWVLLALLRERPFELELNAKRFGTPKAVTCPGGQTISITSEGPWWRLPLNGSAEYRWPAEP